MDSPIRNWKHASVLRFLRERNAQDPVTSIREVARDLVSKAFDAGWGGPPFSPLKLAELRQIDVLPNDHLTDARLVPLGKGRLRIEYNPHERPSRVSFSISHEIGHSMFSDCEEAIRHRAMKKEPHAWELEFLCDVAASEILLPYAAFARDADSAALSIRSMAALADRYKASLEAVLLRLTETSNRPCSILIATFEKNDHEALSVQYSRTSARFALKIPRGFTLPRTSKAYECTNPGWTAKGRETWRVFHSECGIDCIGLPPVRYDDRLRVGILISSETTTSADTGLTIAYEFGDATQPQGSGSRIIAQLVNDAAALGRGFGRAMSERWPASARVLKDWKASGQDFKLGSSKLTALGDGVFVFQMVAQKGVASKKAAGIRYSSLRMCLSELANNARELSASVHMPRIGAGQAGGDWSIVEGVIFEEIVQKGIAVTVYDPPGRKSESRTENQPGLFTPTGSW